MHESQYVWFICNLFKNDEDRHKRHYLMPLLSPRAKLAPPPTPPPPPPPPEEEEEEEEENVGLRICIWLNKIHI